MLCFLHAEVSFLFPTAENVMPICIIFYNKIYYG
uniref:Uncharacterized protein n=1 Tax=Rhizophora mucronata TaxID=61149 RepID=A0A2P2IPD3_RHIMU